MRIVLLGSLERRPKRIVEKSGIPHLSIGEMLGRRRPAETGVKRFDLSRWKRFGAICIYCVSYSASPSSLIDSPHSQSANFWSVLS